MLGEKYADVYGRTIGQEYLKAKFVLAGVILELEVKNVGFW